MEIKKELGDFQTPAILANEMVNILKIKGFIPDVIVEPTCGLGSILLVAEKEFSPRACLGIEIQSKYVEILSKKIEKNVTLLNQDFFASIDDIKKFINNNKKLLFIGNPPWVTNSELSANFSKNLPRKSNIDNISGISAITGKSNFDISEYIIRELIENFSNVNSVFAFLCKTSVAKKIINKLWKSDFNYKDASIYPIDSKKYFNAAVDACFFVLDCSEKKKKNTMSIYDSIESKNIIHISGYINGIYLENIEKADCLEIYGKSPFVWRNGIKHDCSKVMELRSEENRLINGYDEVINIEENLIYPLYKSSDIANGNVKTSKRILVTQKYINEPTCYIENNFPKTWNYLNSHKEDFNKRKSVIYKNKYEFSIFSVGDYSFKPYKIVISGLYKKLNFVLLEPLDGKVAMVDDTCNFISFDTKEQAIFCLNLLNSDCVKRYLNSRISWESKRPIKTEILNSIDLERVSEKVNLKNEFYKLYNIIQENLLFA